MTGRPRSETADLAILDAAVGLLARRGYDGVTMADVAVEAGVGRPTLYRRYQTKEALVGAAIAGLTAGPDPELPDDTAGALLALLRATAEALALPGGMTVIGSLLAQEASDPSLIAAFRERVFAPRHAVVEGVLHRGVASGEVAADVPTGVVIDMLFGSLLARAASGEPVSRAWLAAVVDVAMRAMAPASRPTRPLR